MLTSIGGTIGSAMYLQYMRTEFGRQRAEMAETHRIEMRELDRYNAAERARLEKRIADLEAQLALMVEVLGKRGIKLPQTGPLFSAGGDITIGGDVAGRDKG